jgi:hypothetical protein
VGTPSCRKCKHRGYLYTRDHDRVSSREESPVNLAQGWWTDEACTGHLSQDGSTHYKGVS